jgi:hypothetical protein
MSTIIWRRRQLEQAGFSPLLAARVARDGRYDLHNLLELPGAAAARSSRSEFSPRWKKTRQHERHLRLPAISDCRLPPRPQRIAAGASGASCNSASVTGGRV